MTRLEFDSICRLCVQIFEKGKVFPIFNNNTYDNKISLPERIKCCSSVEVSVDDGLPPHICKTCLTKLNESFVFRNQCVLADKTLKHLKNFRFDVSELPNLSKVDVENQIINSENDNCLHVIYSSMEVNDGNKSKEDFDEFDNSQNGRHKKSIHKLKDISMQKKKAFNRKPKEDVLVQNFHVSEEREKNLSSSPVIHTVKKTRKFERQELEKQNVDNANSKEKLQKLRKSKTKDSKESIKINDKLKSSINSQENSNLTGFIETKECETSKSVSLELNLKGKNSNDSKKVVESQKRGKRKKLSVNKEKPSSFMCDYCQKVYPSEGGWRYHIHTVHNENYQPFICDLCGQAFKVKKNLEAHKNSVHFHLKLHLCDLCGRGFASKYSLKVHKSWHNDEKNFSCDVCGTKFRTRGKMNTHRSIHGGPKNFMCHICSRDFRWKKDFEIHMRTHTGEKPFKCSHCGKAFASLTNMKKHEKNHLKKLEPDETSEKLDDLDLPSDGKFCRNEFVDFGFESEDVRNRQTGQVSGTAVNFICK